MPLRSRAFCLSLRSRRLDFIPGGIYQGALGSFIHSFPYPPRPRHAHTHSRGYRPAMCIWEAVCHLQPFWDCWPSRLPSEHIPELGLRTPQRQLGPGWPRPPCLSVRCTWTSSSPSRSSLWLGIFRVAPVLLFSPTQVPVLR